MFDRIFGKSKISPVRATVPLQPFYVDMAHYIVGDIHGEIDLLDEAIAKIRNHYETDGPFSAVRVVFLGDYVDRGRDSKSVLDVLFELDQDATVVCLKGNHEQMMLDFLDMPTEKGSRWLRYGGLQTLSSYGISGAHERATDDVLLSLAKQFRNAIGPEKIDWLRSLPLWHQNGSMICVHAGLNPHLPLEEQKEKHLLWGHSDFETCPHSSGSTIVHGHTVVDHAGLNGHRLMLDTGAYATGKLTTLFANGDSFSFV